MLKLIKLEKFHDEQASLMLTYLQDAFEDTGIETEFIQNKVSPSRKDVLRGLHYQKEGHSKAKVVRCIRGVLFGVVIDHRKASPTYGQHAENVLSEHNNRMISVPKGLSYGFTFLSEETGIHYKIDELYSPEAEAGIRWDDPDLEIAWPVENPQRSKKDQQLLTFAEAGAAGLHFSA